MWEDLTKLEDVAFNFSNLEKLMSVFRDSFFSPNEMSKKDTEYISWLCFSYESIQALLSIMTKMINENKNLLNEVINELSEISQNSKEETE